MLQRRSRRPDAARIVRRLGIAGIAGLLVWAVAGYGPIVAPRLDAVPAHADVVLVLGPPSAQRVEEAERLLDDGVAGTALVSVPYDWTPWHLVGVCARPDVICADPDPRSTRGEARMLERYADERGWRSAVVVTARAHVSRARMLVGRCFAGDVSMVATAEPPYRGWAYQYAYQTAATVKAWFLQGC
jgi:hypothetical protein